MTEQTTKIIEVEDVLARARDLIECASSAAAHVWGKEADQVSTALEVAGEKIDAARVLLADCREVKEADVASPDLDQAVMATRPH
jgi:hypothetical protein